MITIAEYIGFSVYRRSYLIWSPVIVLLVAGGAVIAVVVVVLVVVVTAGNINDTALVSCGIRALTQYAASCIPCSVIPPDNGPLSAVVCPCAGEPPATPEVHEPNASYDR